MQENLGILEGEVYSLTGDREGRCLVADGTRGVKVFGGGAGGLGSRVIPANAETSEALRFGGVRVPLAVAEPSCCEEDEDAVEMLRETCLNPMPLQTLLSALLLLHVDAERARRYEPDC